MYASVLERHKYQLAAEDQLPEGERPTVYIRIDACCKFRRCCEKAGELVGVNVQVLGDPFHYLQRIRRLSRASEWNTVCKLMRNAMFKYDVNVHPRGC